MNHFYLPTPLPTEVLLLIRSISLLYPAFEAGFAEQTAEYEAIEQNPDSPTFDNTIAALGEVVRYFLVYQGFFTVCWEPIQPMN